MRNKKIERLAREMDCLFRQGREKAEMAGGSSTPGPESEASVLLLDRKGNIGFCNDSSGSISGVFAGGGLAAGRPFFEFVSAAYSVHFKENFNRAVAGEVVNQESVIDVPGGASRCYSLHFDPVFSDLGDVTGVCLAVLDITRFRKHEEALRKSLADLEELNREINNHENFLKVLLDSIPVPVFYKDDRLRYLGCNKAFNRITGLETKDVLGKTAAEIWPDNFSDAFHQKDLELIESQEEQEYEWKIEAKNGKLHDVIYRKNIFRDDQGRIAGLVGSFAEITDRKKTEASLESSRDQFRILFEKAPIGYQSLDINGDLIMVNQTWLDILGFPNEEVIGRNFSEFLTGNSREAFSTCFARIKEEGIITGAEFQLVKKDGGIIDVSYNGIALRDNDGNFQKTQCVFLDITRNKAVLRAMRRIAGQAKGLRGHIPICAGCRKIQDIEKKDKPWVVPEIYIPERLPDISFSHGMCPECIRKWYPEYKR